MQATKIKVKVHMFKVISLRVRRCARDIKVMQVSPPELHTHAVYNLGLCITPKVASYNSCDSA